MQSGGFRPLTTDCSRLIDTLNTGLTNGTNSVISVDPGKTWSATRGSCRFAFLNSGTTTLETCLVSIVRVFQLFDREKRLNNHVVLQLRSASASVNTCFGSLQNLLATEGLCLANSGAWEVRCVGSPILTGFGRLKFLQCHTLLSQVFLSFPRGPRQCFSGQLLSVSRLMISACSSVYILATAYVEYQHALSIRFLDPCRLRNKRLAFC